ncbi:MAG: hypothetical protein BAJALOKI1v1_40011 [Promethearchaeota archaeon]|nr:MAG: hypothetical protein BAJALOKI1v1_40011 [Candidatus Lokiarchaeota archaeon]
MKTLLIAGGGKFSKKALHFAKKNHYATILIDNDPNCIASKIINTHFQELKLLLANFDRNSQNSIVFFENNIIIINELLKKIKFEWIIPVIPLHLTALIVKNFLSSCNIELVPDGKRCITATKRINPALLLDSLLQENILYLSYAKQNEVCPDNCAGPSQYCPNFDREKPITLTNYLKKIFNVSNNINLSQERREVNIVLHSYQLLPGLGGLKGGEIEEVLAKINKHLDLLRKNNFRLLIATSCNCHGVVNFYKIA